MLRAADGVQKHRRRRPTRVISGPALILSIVAYRTRIEAFTVDLGAALEM
jgi:hypothetical protein